MQEASSGYLEVQEASSGYLEVQEASSGYLEVQEASSGYLEVQEASSGYLEVQGCRDASIGTGQHKIYCLSWFLHSCFHRYPLQWWGVEACYLLLLLLCRPYNGVCRPYNGVCRPYNGVCRPYKGVLPASLLFNS